MVFIIQLHISEWVCVCGAGVSELWVQCELVVVLYVELLVCVV